MSFCLTAHKIEEVYASLAKSSSDIYIQRSRQLYLITGLRTKLFTWNMENVEIIALADTSIHGKENVINNMKDIDPDRCVLSRNLSVQESTPSLVFKL